MVRTGADERDDRLIAWIDLFLATHKYAPTVREIGEAFDLTSSATVHVWLKRLKRQGRITWQEGQTRTITTIKWEDE